MDLRNKLFATTLAAILTFGCGGSPTDSKNKVKEGEQKEENIENNYLREKVTMLKIGQQLTCEKIKLTRLKLCLLKIYCTQLS